MKSLPQSAPQTPPSLAADDAVYAIWIGTNDLANHGFLTDMQEPNRTIADSMDFIYAGLDGVYARGTLSFVLMNIPPMQLTPLSETPERGGVGETWAWPDKLGNITRMTHLYNHPYEYLAALANVTGYNYHCNLDMSECQGLGNPESFMWFDYSHPSQRTEQIIGEQFLDVVSGENYMKRKRWAG
ncbi:GDSL lipase/acylhydrolase [Blastomyces dermatitidis ER-3]|uniref:GDSL lipase/acylhydrolase n=1 Tax=Ajellomyces dermatitidis (strain ER-3 / ATCC MYA-2586) TaxID=559297 RepID=A0ABP2EZV6_AJEDR|nr:GDSL lipase/acylhydrolase [Blastomyces dermatitidis ER-3]EEQ89896.2 GDSL lipase/acylhydrolase [Blastomyces dermatitidis ER-3]